MTERFYDAIADWYDLEFEGYDADLDLYLGYAGMVGGPILELGCGTGRLVVPLAQAGFEVVGIDSSAAMIERAAARVASARLTNCRLERGDMRQLDGLAGSEFRLVFSAINSFLHLETRPDQLAALEGVRQLLHADGLLVLDLFHPTPGVLQQMDDRLTFDGHWALPDGEFLERFSHRRVHPAEQRVVTRLMFDRGDASGTLTRISTEYSMRYIHRFEMEGLLDESGFELEGVYGSYALDALDDHAAQMIFVAHRR